MRYLRPNYFIFVGVLLILGGWYVLHTQVSTVHDIFVLDNSDNDVISDNSASLLDGIFVYKLPTSYTYTPPFLSALIVLYAIVALYAVSASLLFRKVSFHALWQKNCNSL